MHKETLNNNIDVVFLDEEEPIRAKFAINVAKDIG